MKRNKYSEKNAIAAETLRSSQRQIVHTGGLNELNQALEM